MVLKKHKQTHPLNSKSKYLINKNVAASTEITNNCAVIGRYKEAFDEFQITIEAYEH
jgi:hypothetical protein